MKNINVLINLNELLNKKSEDLTDKDLKKLEYVFDIFEVDNECKEAKIIVHWTGHICVDLPHDRILKDVLSEPIKIENEFGVKEIEYGILAPLFAKVDILAGFEIFKQENKLDFKFSELKSHNEREYLCDRLASHIGIQGVFAYDGTSHMNINQDGYVFLHIDSNENLQEFFNTLNLNEILTDDNRDFPFGDVNYGKLKQKTPTIYGILEEIYND